MEVPELVAIRARVEGPRAKAAGDDHRRRGAAEAGDRASDCAEYGVGARPAGRAAHGSDAAGGPVGDRIAMLRVVAGLPVDVPRANRLPEWMPLSRRKRLPDAPAPQILDIEDEDALGHGVVRVGGVTWRIKGSLRGERVRAVPTHFHAGAMQARLEATLIASGERAEVVCTAFDRCGGCSWQHLHVEQQRARKSRHVLDLLAARDVVPCHVDATVTGPTVAYRRRARLSVRHIASAARTFVGFRESRSNRVCEIDGCPMLVAPLAASIAPLRTLLGRLSIAHALPQVEVAAGDDGVALVLRHLLPLAQRDRRQLADFARAHGYMLLLQADAPEAAIKLWPEDDRPARLHYALPAHGIKLAFHPLDFVQINAEVNERLVDAVVEMLAPQPDDCLLDLFCGIGNLTLPIARRARQVVGIDHAVPLIERAIENGHANDVTNVRFIARDLARDPAGIRKFAATAVVVDPPRSGAADVLPHIVQLAPSRIVYVSCSPETLARDAAALAQHGFQLSRLQTFDMFPHTAHVESVALFVR